MGRRRGVLIPVAACAAWPRAWGSRRGAVDNLKGLKENVLLGHLIPAGTGFEPYLTMKVKRMVEPPVTEADEEEAMLAEAAETAEALGAERVGTMVEVVAQSEAGSPVKS